MNHRSTLKRVKTPTSIRLTASLAADRCRSRVGAAADAGTRQRPLAAIRLSGSTSRHEASRSVSPVRQRAAPSAQQRATAALMAPAADSKGIVDDVCAKKAVAELART